MKITIINPLYNRIHLHDTIDGNIWSSTAGCFFKRTCSSCPFYTTLRQVHAMLYVTASLLP